MSKSSKQFDFDLSFFTLGDYLNFISIMIETSSTELANQMSAHARLAEFAVSFLEGERLIMAEDIMPMIAEFGKALAERMEGK